MDDSDEYFDDSFVLDEAALASIQATEEHFGVALSQALPTPPRLQASSSPRPSKRLKTSHDSSDPVGSLGVSRVPPRPVLIEMESSDLNPEIRVGPDGNYLVSSQYKAQMNATSSDDGIITMQQSLRDAQDALLVKAGEVSILRQTIDKTKKEYAEVVAKAKAEMIAHEKVKAELQAKLREETERLATQLVFQQHQMETSTRKPLLGSMRSRRMAKDSSMAVAATPTRVQRSFPLPSTSRPARGTSPGKGRVRIQLEGDNGPLSSPTNGEHKTTRASEDVKQPRFKGFHNTFIDAGPVMARSSPASGGDGSPESRRSDPFLTPIKAKANVDHNVYVRELGGGNEKGTEVDGQARCDWWEKDTQNPLGGAGEDTLAAVDQGDGGLSLRLVSRMNEEDLIIEEDVDCSEELRRIVFTHIAPRNNVLTLHMLFSTVIPPETSSTEKQAYMTACQIILRTCGERHDRTQDSEWEATVIHKVASAFIVVGDILRRTGCVAPLTALLDLLMLLTLYIPAFVSPFLGLSAIDPVASHDTNKSSQVLPMLCNIVRDHLHPPKPNLGDVDIIDGKESVRSKLAMAVVQLMESLCWRAQHELVDQFSVLSRQSQVFEILLDPAQPRELIARALQLLILLTTQQDMVRCLFSSYEADTVDNRPPSPFSKDAPRISLIERLCCYLVEPAVQESYRIRHLVIALISNLADSNIEARTILLDSASLAPSLVISITNLSRLLWEDDASNMDTPELAKLTVDLLYSTVNLLHRLVFVLDLTSVLGRKLVEATRLPGPFNGVTHMFVVTFGRLSWAEGPDWLDEACKGKCEVIAELAMEIIETVVTGPECDSLWAVWHQSEATDEEELEAWTIQTD